MKRKCSPTPPVRVFPDGREVCTKTAAGKREYDLRTEKMATRQWELCAICEEYMMLATFDHEAGRGMGGAKRDDRIWVNGQWQNAALCLKCNGAKGSKQYHWQGGSYVPV